MGLSLLSNSFLVIAIALVAGSLIFAILGYFVAVARRVAPWIGLLLGLIFGPMGVLFVGLLSLWGDWAYRNHYITSEME